MNEDEFQIHSPKADTVRSSTQTVPSEVALGSLS
jgi:hypothetical protein